MRWGFVYFAGFMVLWGAGMCGYLPDIFLTFFPYTAFFASPFARRDTMYINSDQKWWVVPGYFLSHSYKSFTRVDEEERETDANTSE